MTESDLTHPLPGLVKSPSLKTLCSITRSTGTSCTSCHPRNGWKNRRESAWRSEMLRKRSRPSRRACCSPSSGTEVAGRGGPAWCPLTLWRPGHGLTLRLLAEPQGSAHKLTPGRWDQFSKPSFLLQQRLDSLGGPGEPCAPEPSGSPPLFPVGPGIKGKTGFRGTWLPQAGGALPQAGQVDTFPLLPPEWQGSKKPAKLLQVMRLRQFLSGTASPQQGNQPSLPGGLDPKR